MLDAAATLFALRGVDAVSLRDIAAAADVHLALIRLYVGTLVLAEPRPRLAMLSGAPVGLPCASYIGALHHLVAGEYPTATQVIAVVVFVAIEFLLILVPFAFLGLRPEATNGTSR